MAMDSIDVAVAGQGELSQAQRFYQSRGYGGAAIVSSDHVVVARAGACIVGVGRLCREDGLLWVRGMQIEPRYQRRGIGSMILRQLEHAIRDRWCCCLPYGHLVGFHRQAAFEPAAGDLPPALGARLGNYLARGLDVLAMVRTVPVPARVPLDPASPLGAP